MLPREYGELRVDLFRKRIPGDNQAFLGLGFLSEEMKPLGPYPRCMPARFDFNRHFPIPENQIHFRTARGPPIGYGEIFSAVMSIGPAFLKDKMFKGSSILPSAWGQRVIVQKAGNDAGIEEIKLGGFDEPPLFRLFPGGQQSSNERILKDLVILTDV